MADKKIVFNTQNKTFFSPEQGTEGQGKRTSSLTRRGYFEFGGGKTVKIITPKYTERMVILGEPKQHKTLLDM